MCETHRRSAVYSRSPREAVLPAGRRKNMQKRRSSLTCHSVEVSCARLASASTPASHPRKKPLPYDQPTGLPCRGNKQRMGHACPRSNASTKRLYCPTRSARGNLKIRLAGDTNVKVSIAVAVNTWVACDGVDRTCHSTVDALVLALNKTAPSTADVF